ncbi:16S rRNA (cytosine(1402)-N(4))-methyltransferase RsmH [Synechococcus sp. PCC 7502]|uniref:16S rRNA (cytosine(1402)-N(4))-methyltransferase RsmH n=1 Tax=Synechococcus sp. PCC 7502 TaxID=1173263 RepID=UPI000316C9F2|nr:16S rRNA (cytosine(1402)-N(4))-methyltransferase RsmH [Synechococcus sp. PCC 7502]
MQYQHTPVLPEQLISGMQIKSGGIYLDCTVGGGGHSALILQKFADIKLVAIDHDAMAIAAAQANLSIFGDRIKFWHGNFSQYQPEQKFDGIIADLGVSSAQLDIPERGFSFRDCGDLDMRMDQSQSLTAADIINNFGETELAKIFFELGEERYSYRIARAIANARPLHTTTQLADVIFHAVPRNYRYGRIHPATRVFQALRITVNQELKSLETLLEKSPDWLEAGGKIGIISFHSLEDRIVKHRLKEDDRLRVETKKPIMASESETLTNPRSRSAKLRIATKTSYED